MRLRVALTLSLLAAQSQPEIQVSLRDGRVVIRAARAPLAEVLKRFAEATGTEVVYEAARPRQLVSVAIEGGSAAEALVHLLEGQGLNYVLRLDPTGKIVEMLVVVGSPSPAPAPAGADRTPRGGPPAPPAPEQEQPEEPESEPPPEAIIPPGQEPQTPETPPGTAAPAPEQPQPPGPASYPGGTPWPPPPPQAPVPPGPASYPR